MPKISVNPSASNAYCAPKLTPMIAACRNSCTSVRRPSRRLHHRLDLGDAQILAVPDDADPEREEQLLIDAKGLLPGPHPLAHVRVLDRQLAQRLSYLLHVVNCA